MAKRFLTRLLTQTAVYWDSPVPDGYGGITFTNSPVEIRVRWEQKQELFLSGAGEELLSRAIVYASQNITVGSYLYLGTLASLMSSNDPDVLVAIGDVAVGDGDVMPAEVSNDPVSGDFGAMKTMGVDSSPDVKGNNYLWKIWLR